MKTTQTKKAKIKNLKVGAKQTKAKLPQYKRRITLVCGRRRSFLKCLIMSSSSTKTKNGQGTSTGANSPRNKQLVQQCTVKRKKKKSHTIDDGPTTKAQYAMESSFESSDDSAEVRLATDRHHKQYHDVSKQQRTIGSPVIVETLSDSLSSLKIPEVLRQNQKVKTESNARRYNFSCNPRTRSKKDEACIIIAESVNPNNTPHSQGNDTRTPPPLKCNRKPRKEKTPFQDKNVNIPANTWDSSDSTPSFEECLENIRVDTINRANSIVQTKTAVSTFKKNKDNSQDDQYPLRFYCLRNKVVVVMSKQSRFCFTGKLLLKVLYGAVEAYGCVITTETQPTEIYSPRGYSSVAIETRDKFPLGNEPDIWTSLCAEGVNRNAQNKLVDAINRLQPGMAVILLSNLENKLTKFLNVFFPFRLFPKIRHVPYQSWTEPKRAEVILQSRLHIGRNTSKELIIDQRVAQDVAEDMLNRWRNNEWSCTLMAGGKNVGKSTATRYLINNLLPVSKMVVLVDVDPGQTECTPPGCISYSLIEQPLLGPNFTHLMSPVFQLYIGDVNVARCITRYIEGIKMLMDRLSSCPVLSRLPIVVNTIGFTSGIGWDIAVFTIKLIRPSLVVQIMSEKPKNNYANYLSKQVVNEQDLPWASWSANIVDWSRPCDHELCVVRSNAERKGAPGNDSWNMEPYQQRELAMICYLSEIVQSPANSTLYYDAVSFSINRAVPYVTSFSSLTISIPRASVPPSHILNVMNGNIVALCGIDLEELESEETEVTFGPRVLNRSPLCACYGFGIVRGIDTEREEVFINTPLTVSMMQYVNYLVGCIPVPVTLLQSQQQRNAPYTGGDDVLPTSREPRRGYFRMRYQQVQNNS